MLQLDFQNYTSCEDITFFKPNFLAKSRRQVFHLAHFLQNNVSFLFKCWLIAVCHFQFLLCIHIPFERQIVRVLQVANIRGVIVFQELLLSLNFVV